MSLSAKSSLLSVSGSEHFIIYRKSFNICSDGWHLLFYVCLFVLLVLGSLGGVFVCFCVFGWVFFSLIRGFLL